MKSSPHPDIDWTSLLKKVLVVAINLFRNQGLYANEDSDSVLKGLGISPEDLAHTALKEFFKHRVLSIEKDTMPPLKDSVLQSSLQ